MNTRIIAGFDNDDDDNNWGMIVVKQILDRYFHTLKIFIKSFTNRHSYTCFFFQGIVVAVVICELFVSYGNLEELFPYNATYYYVINQYYTQIK